MAEALTWLAKNKAMPGTSVITSLPDHSEVTSLDFKAWRDWFVASARAIVRWLPDDGHAVFFQSDVIHQGILVDKGYLIVRAADEEQAPLLWHKIVCRKPPGTIAMGRPSYSHMICIAKKFRDNAKRLGADVLPDAGYMPWSRAMGELACRAACQYLKDETATHTIVDPFCGKGSVLAVANALGLAAVGIDLSAARCRAALKQNLLVSSRRPK